MSDQNMTRRAAVKLGGATLAGLGLSAGATAATPAASGADFPDFRGKTVSFYTQTARSHHLLTNPELKVLGGRLFLVGTVPVLGHWTDGLTGVVAWDVVDSYLVYDSIEDYHARCEAYRKDKEANGENGAATDRPHD